MRAMSCGKLDSLSSYLGGSSPANRAAPPLALSVTIMTCRASGNMSGNRRLLTSTAGSIFFASACAAPFASTPARLVSMRINDGTDAWYMDRVMGGSPVKTWNQYNRYRSHDPALPSLVWCAIRAYPRRQEADEPASFPPEGWKS